MDDLEKWLPQLATFGHSDMVDSDLLAFTQLHNTTAPFAPIFVSPSSREFELSATSPGIQNTTLHMWQLAQATAFATTVRYLTEPKPTDPPLPDERPHFVPWLQRDRLAWDSLPDQEQIRQATIQHTFAN